MDTTFKRKYEVSVVYENCVIRLTCLKSKENNQKTAVIEQKNTAKAEKRLIPYGL